MHAEIAGELVSKFIEKQWPSDKEDVYEILRLGINKAWQEGKWIGMTAELTVPIHKDRNGQSYFMAPQSHPILLAINGLSQGIPIRDKYFMFHRNGYGDIRNSPSCKWNTDVYDIGSTPYFDENNIDFSKGVMIGVRSLGPAGANEKVFIKGKYKSGEQVYTYKNSEFGTPCGCQSTKETVDTMNGIEIKVTSDFNYVCNVKFSDISAITKTFSQSPVEIIAIDSDNSAYRIGKLDPNQRFSSYRKYLVPNELCGKQSLHAMFKIAKQEIIKSSKDELIISNDEALISLAKGIYFMYYKEQQEVGASFIIQGITVLEKEKREEESPSEFPIQVSVESYQDLPEILRYHQ